MYVGDDLREQGHTVSFDTLLGSNKLQQTLRSERTCPHFLDRNRSPRSRALIAVAKRTRSNALHKYDLAQVYLELRRDELRHAIGFFLHHLHLNWVELIHLAVYPREQRKGKHSNAQTMSL